jgi:hypothetical protein
VCRLAAVCGGGLHYSRAFERAGGSNAMIVWKQFQGCLQANYQMTLIAHTACPSNRQGSPYAALFTRLGTTQFACTRIC